MNELSIGKEVWWEDPAGQTSGIYVVDEIKREEGEGLYDDTIVLISNDSSEAEVMAGELQDLEHRRKCISDFVDLVTKIAEEDNWSVHNYDKEFNKVDLEFGKYSSMGQDFSFSISCETGDIDDFVDEVEKYYDSFDPAEEATKWLDPDGHGHHGAPHDFSTILEDMKECETNIGELLDLFKEKLQGIKRQPKCHYLDYSKRLLQVRAEVIETIFYALKAICVKKGVRSVTWSELTNNECPDICVASEGDSWCNLPETIEQDDDQPRSFKITFASYCDCPPSFDGENIYTETLIDILERLETYNNKI